MKLSLHGRKNSRFGAVAPLAAILMIPLLGMVAFAVDMGYIEVCRSELQGAADSAALAGAQQLEQPYMLWLAAATSAEKNTIRSEAISSAQSTAQTYSSTNVAGGVNVSLLTADIAVGFLDASGNFTANPSSTVFPNSVQVTTRRDSTSNGQVGLFFGPVVGMSSVAMTATARATTYTATVTGFSTTPGLNAGIMPMTYDVAHWSNFMATGQDPDGNITTDNLGQPEIQVYPSIKYTGNFGELSLDDSTTGASTINGWINNGVSPADIQVLQTANLIPVSSSNNTWNWLGNPGLKSSTIQDLNNYDAVQAINDYVGQSFMLPLFKAYDSDPANYQAGVGNGSNFNYNIVGFVPVIIMPVSQTNKQIVVQPSTMYNSTMVIDPTTVTPGGTSTSSYNFVFIPAKLSR